MSKNTLSEVRFILNSIVSVTDCICEIRAAVTTQTTPSSAQPHASVSRRTDECVCVHSVKPNTIHSTASLFHVKWFSSRTERWRCWILLLCSCSLCFCWCRTARRFDFLLFSPGLWTTYTAFVKMVFNALCWIIRKSIKTAYAAELTHKTQLQWDSEDTEELPNIYESYNTHTHTHQLLWNLHTYSGFHWGMDY